jgi:FkbM family methyltransferase
MSLGFRKKSEVRGDLSVQSSDCFDVHHSGLEGAFQFSSSNNLDTVGVTVREQGLAAYEAPVTDILIELVKVSSGVILDVGANTGLYTLAAAAAGPAIQVIAFEPLAPVRGLLQRNVSLNPDLESRITIEPVGLSSEAGSFSFYETINNRGYVSTSSSFEPQHVEIVGGEFVEHVIRTVTLDDFALSLGGRRVSFMKIDVEGHEHAVITGGRRFLAEHRPIFTVEILSNSEKGPIDKFLIEEDYLAFAMAPGVLRQRDHMMFFSDAWNHLLVPAEKQDQIVALSRKLGIHVEPVE